MNETHATKYLLSLPQEGPKNTAERTRRLLEALDSPQKNRLVIKILGEAGKSSVAHLLAALFSRAALPCITVSLVPQKEPRRAIGIEDAPPSHGDFAKGVSAAWQAARICGVEAPSYEEILLCAALWLSREKGCRIILTELSSSNEHSAASALTRPRLCLFTASSLACAERLIPLIDTAADLVSAPQTPAVFRLLTERAAAIRCRLSFPVKNQIGEPTPADGGLRFSYGGSDFLLSTLAQYQHGNALAVIEAYRALVRQGLSLSSEQLRDALAVPPSPLCFRAVSLSPVWLIDAADTPLRLSALAASLDRLPRLTHDGFTLWTEPPLRDICLEAFGSRVASVQTFESGHIHRTLKQITPPSGSPLVITGSAPFAGEMLDALGARFLL